MLKTRSRQRTCHSAPAIKVGPFMPLSLPIVQNASQYYASRDAVCQHFRIAASGVGGGGLEDDLCVAENEDVVALHFLRRARELRPTEQHGVWSDNLVGR